MLDKTKSTSVVRAIENMRRSMEMIIIKIYIKNLHQRVKEIIKKIQEKKTYPRENVFLQ